ncbi:MAG: type I-U CRISPR-associated protein Cas7 [Planctomycetes bacterium]|nr:type I-U CRISPR-associated protein Cas7 [Planctomycetota bacterium]
MSENTSNHDALNILLGPDGPVAIIIKRPLEPVDNEEPVIFPPTYPVTKWKGRVHTIRDGDYRVSVQLPPDSKNDKDGNKDSQKPGYQIDYFPDGTNICEIDSPQSQSNRVEPKFKAIKGGSLVPQIEIQIGSDKKNLLEIGHRAGDAAVRMSSMAPDFHDAFTAAKRKDFFTLASLAPTSLVFGVWDSRSTYVKQQRIFKAYIRASNVFEMSRSAQFTPSTNYVDAGAIGGDVEKKERGPTGEESNLSQEGMVHALSTQTAGGVKLTDKSQLVRTVNVNVEAIRQLAADAAPLPIPQDATDEQRREIEDRNKQQTAAKRTAALQKYILGLALVAAIEEPELNLREGCHLRFKDGEANQPTYKLIYRSKPSDPWTLDRTQILDSAEKAKQAFFKVAQIDEDKIDHPDVKFEKGVAENFLSRPKGERDKIRVFGPITKTKLGEFDAAKKNREQAADPNEKLRKLADGLKVNKAGTKLNDAPVKKLTEFLDSIQQGDELKATAVQIRNVLDGDDDPAKKVTRIKDLVSSEDSESEENDASTDASEEQEASE